MLRFSRALLAAPASAFAPARSLFSGTKPICAHPTTPALFLLELSTGIVGLEVVPNAREVLLKLYSRTLAEIKVVPEGVFYREHVEEFTKYRMGVVERLEDVRFCGRGAGGEACACFYILERSVCLFLRRC